MVHDWSARAAAWVAEARDVYGIDGFFLGDKWEFDSDRGCVVTRDASDGIEYEHPAHAWYVRLHFYETEEPDEKECQRLHREQEGQRLYLWSFNRDTQERKRREMERVPLPRTFLERRRPEAESSKSSPLSEPPARTLLFEPLRTPPVLAKGGGGGGGGGGSGAGSATAELGNTGAGEETAMVGEAMILESELCCVASPSVIRWSLLLHLRSGSQKLPPPLSL